LHNQQSGVYLYPTKIHNLKHKYMMIIYGVNHPPQDTQYCKFCDSEHIRYEAYQLAKEMVAQYYLINTVNVDEPVDADSFVDDCIEEVKKGYSLCKDCQSDY